MANLEHTRGQRLDQKVVELLPQLSRAAATKLIEDGRVTVNNEHQNKPGYKLRESDDGMVEYEAEVEERIPDIELPIVYEDEDCVVINKPVGLLTHSKGALNPEPTVATWLFRHCTNCAKQKKHENNQLSSKNPKSDLNCDRSDLSHTVQGDTLTQTVTGPTYHTEVGGVGGRGGIVHRLDRATSGVMICAKNTEALKKLQKQFSQRKTKKTYFAVVSGRPKVEAAVIDMPIERNPKAPATFRVGPQGKDAKTTYEVVQSNDAYSLLKLTPETGRTHQLRVHLKQIGHPIVGDVLYDGKAGERLMLHAESLEITIPKNSERKVFQVSVPTEFEQCTCT